MLPAYESRAIRCRLGGKVPITLIEWRIRCISCGKDMTKVSNWTNELTSSVSPSFNLDRNSVSSLDWNTADAVARPPTWPCYEQVRTMLTFMLKNKLPRPRNSWTNPVPIAICSSGRLDTNATAGQRISGNKLDNLEIKLTVHCLKNNCITKSKRHLIYGQVHHDNR